MQTTNRFLNDTAYCLFILVLAALTATLAVVMPTMALPVLFEEISADIGLSLVQIGVIWGSISLAGRLTGIAGGSLGDRFHAQRHRSFSLAGGLEAGTLFLRGTGPIDEHPLGAHDNPATSIRQVIRQVVRLRGVWLLGLAMLGVGGGIQGYLAPLCLSRNKD